MATSQWSGISTLKLEDPVSLVDYKSCVLQGIVAYVGEVHFEVGIWVGVQLTGPSVGKGYNDGSVGSHRYFGSVGRGNGVFCHISRIQRRATTLQPDTTGERLQTVRQSDKAQLADLKYVDTLKKERENALLRKSEEKRRFFKKGTEDIYIQRLKQKSLQELRISRDENLEDELLALPGPRLKFAGVSSSLCQADYEFMKGLQDAQQNFVLTDPTLPDNPVTMASQAFQNMTRYPLSEILGKNCRFLQGPKTSQRAVSRVRFAIQEGADCSICLLNYRKDGSTFWNEFFITALRDNRGRIKNYIGVLCEVSEEVAAMRNKEAAATPTRSRFSQVPKYVETFARPDDEHTYGSHEGPEGSPTAATQDITVFRMPEQPPSPPMAPMIPMEHLRQVPQENQRQATHGRSVSALRDRFAEASNFRSSTAIRERLNEANAHSNERTVRNSRMDPSGQRSQDPPSSDRRSRHHEGRGRQMQHVPNYPRDPSPTHPGRSDGKSSRSRKDNRPGRSKSKSRGFPRVKSQPNMRRSQEPRSSSRGVRDSPGSGPAGRKSMRREFTRHYFSNASARFSSASTNQSPSLTESSINSSYPDSNLSSVEVSPGGIGGQMLPSALKAKSYELSPGMNIVQLEVDWPGDAGDDVIQR